MGRITLDDYYKLTNDNRVELYPEMSTRDNLENRLRDIREVERLNNMLNPVSRPDYGHLSLRDNLQAHADDLRRKQQQENNISGQAYAQNNNSTPPQFPAATSWGESMPDNQSPMWNNNPALTGNRQTSWNNNRMMTDNQQPAFMPQTGTTPGFNVRKKIETTPIQPFPSHKIVEENEIDYSKYGEGISKDMVDNMLADTRFQNIINKTEKNEGGYASVNDDLGGETNMGISSKWYPNEDIKNMTKERARAILYRDFWTKNNINELPDGLADVVFDRAVNQGAVTSIRHLHKALGIKPGEIIGNQTLNKLNEVDNINDIRQDFLNEVNNYYREIAKKNPKQKKFLKGWLNRGN